MKQASALVKTNGTRQSSLQADFNNVILVKEYISNANKSLLKVLRAGSLLNFFH